MLTRHDGVSSGFWLVDLDRTHVIGASWSAAAM